MKRVFALSLAAVMLVISLCMSVSANVRGFREEIRQESSEWISDDQMYVLNALGISQWASVYDMGSKVNEKMSRWYAAEYLTKLVDIETSAPAEFEALFRDLTSEHQYYGKIKGVVNAGYMKGDPDGYFRPGEQITVREAATALLRVLGYKQYMEVFGVDKALKKTGITEGLESVDEMTHVQFLRIIYNALNSPAVKQTRFEATGVASEYDVELELDENYLGFEMLFGLIHESAVLDGVRGTTLERGGEFLNDGCVSVAGVNYKYEPDVAELLGYNVDYFYKEINGAKEIIHLYKNDKNKEFVLTHDEIEGFSDGVYTYIDNDREKRIVIDNTTKIIYNGVANPSYSRHEMMPEFGTVTFIDNDGKKGYETVKINSFEFFYVSSLNEAENKVYDKRGDVVKQVDFDDFDVSEIHNDGELTSFMRIREGNLLAIRKSSPNSGYSVINAEIEKVFRKNIKCSGIKKESVLFDDEEKALWINIESDPVVGIIYDVYVFDDQVVMVTESELSGGEMVYLLNASAENEAFSSEKKILAVNEKLEQCTFECAEKVFIDGTGYTDIIDIRTALINSAMNYSSGYTIDCPVAQPARLQFNGAGKVHKIDTMYHDGSREPETSIKAASELKNVQARHDAYSTSLYTLREGTSQYRDLVATCGGSTKIILVPVNDKMDKTEYYSNFASGMANKGLGDGSMYVMDVINRDENSKIAEYIFVYDNRNAEMPWSRSSIIYDLRAEYDAELEETKYIVDVYHSNYTRTHTCDKELFEQLNIGDVYMIQTDKNNHIADVKKIYGIGEAFPDKPNRQAMAGTVNYSLTYAVGSIFGTLVNADGNYATVCQSLVSDPEGFDKDFNVDNFIIGSGSGVYLYSAERGNPKVEKISLKDALTYTDDPENASKVIVNVYNGVSNLYIIKD